MILTSLNRKRRAVIGITGGAGYIGSSLARHLARFFEVEILDIKAPSDRFEAHVKFQKCDARDCAEVKKAIEDVDVIIHTSIVQIPAINEKKKLGYEVNLLGTQNVCKAVDENKRTKGLILAGSWHTVGERGLEGFIDEEFGFRPDKVEERARLYALSKIAQESIVRFYDEMSEKVFGIIRMGTVLGDGMPKTTAANIFIENGLAGKPLTPYRHSMHRPMLYVDINDACRAYGNLARKILNGKIHKKNNSLANIYNVFYPKPITILELAESIKKAITEFSAGKLCPDIQIVDTGQPNLFREDDKELIVVDIRKALNILDLRYLRPPSESIARIIKLRMRRTTHSIESKRHCNNRPSGRRLVAKSP
ncbi:MAG TPA: NAD(P)-dependent oxidoreductase [Candidatus Bathyarchaeia archaeon]|nr:NAD(P)-dependent oxidoreductase [Candidatus Bathyarchaeia archaeon]